MRFLMNSQQATSPAWHRWAEPIAAGLNLAYTMGYLWGAPWAFSTAAVGSVIFAIICWQKKLLAETANWVFYIGFAVYGTWAVQTSWPHPLPVASGEAHTLSIVIGVICWLAVGWMLKRSGRAADSYLDAFTTVGSLVATYWMLQFVQANWLYWIVIDSVAIFMYIRRSLFWGAGLYALYTLLAIEGWFNLVTWI